MQRHREDAEVVGDLLDHHSGSAFLSDAHDTATFFQGSPVTFFVAPELP